MEIMLQEPFLSKWSKGYKVYDTTTGRYRVVLYNNQNDISGMSYARYLMSVKLGHEVPPQYVVDHIDDDKTNDDINNLQILTAEQNRIKQQWHYIEHVQVCYGVECNWCGVHFLLTERDVKTRLAKGVTDVFCSRSCASSFHGYYRTKSDDLIAKVKNLRSQGLSSYKIAEQLAISRNTVMKYWN